MTLLFESLDAGRAPLGESAKTAALSVTHAPIGKGGTNWITRSKPGNTGQLPAYIQNVRNAIMRDGKSESQATAIAIGRVRDWASGKGNVGPEVKAAAAKAIAEFEKMRGGSKLKENWLGLTLADLRVVAAALEEADLLDAAGILELTRRAERWPSHVPFRSVPTGVSRRSLVLLPPDDPTLDPTGDVVEAFDEKAHPRGHGGKWVKKGAYGATKHGQLFQIKDPTPITTPSHWAGKVHTHQGRVVDPETLTPKTVKYKKIEPKGGAENKRFEVHVDGEHIGDVAHTDSLHHVRGSVGNISIGMTREKGWHDLAPGEAARTGSYHHSRHDAASRLHEDHVKKKANADVASQLSTNAPINANAWDPTNLQGAPPAQLHGLLRQAENKLVTAAQNREEGLRRIWQRRSDLTRAELKRRGIKVVEDDRTAHQQRLGARRAAHAAAAAAGKYKGPKKSPTKAPPAAAAATAASGARSAAVGARGGQFAGSSPGGAFVRVGASGAEVQGVQAAVHAKTDGAFGAKTVAAVKRFQQRNGLTVDGVVGRQTFAALSGKKNAASVKTGALSTAQVGQLKALARGGGTLLTPRRRKMLKEEWVPLEESQRTTHEDFGKRVRDLKQGEVTRTPDGLAVGRMATPDGRDVFKVSHGGGDGELRFPSYGETHRSADHAIRDARLRSARSNDPESLGGEESYGYGATHQGDRVHLVDVTDNLQPVVRRTDSLSGPEKTLSWAQLSGRGPRCLREAAAEVAADLPFFVRPSGLS